MSDKYNSGYLFESENDEGSDCVKEACGIVGVFGNPEASTMAYLGLYALQHRGQESCGIVTMEPSGK